MTPFPTDPPGADEPWHVLALNSGSSSLKFGLYRVQGRNATGLLTGAAASRGDGTATFQARDAAGRVRLRETAAVGQPADILWRVVRLLADARLPQPQAIGHRVVHGGPQLRQHTRIDATVLRQMADAAVYAPLHAPAALALIDAALQHFPRLPQVACFDTTFHAGMPEVASTLPLPRAWRDEGLRRYGFHGLSCESIVHQLRHDSAGGVPQRLLIAHLGHGASVTAVRGGVSVDTSMGLTPAGGLLMGTRSGDLDPGLLLHLMRVKQLDAGGIEDLVERHGGLLGISGLSADMRALHTAAPDHPDAALAIEMFCHTTAKALAGLCAVLDGLDTLVFTGGIGENDAAVRAAICARLGFLGVHLRDAGGKVRVLPSQEDEQIARHVAALRPDWADADPGLRAPTHRP